MAMLARSLGLLIAISLFLAAQGSTAELEKSEPAQTESVSPLGNKDAGRSETAIGDMIADAVRSLLRTDIAFVATSEIKPKDPPIPAGKVTITDIRSLISYPDDPLAILELTGNSIKQALERAVSIYPQPNLAFLQVAGLKFTFDPQKPYGQRILSVSVGSSPLETNATYTVGVTNSMANGALGYWKVWGESNIKQRLPETSIINAVETFFRANPKIDYSKLDRITRVE
ncbi:MAG: 5'-nucleotidase [Armatimonadota bacterium]